MLIPNRLCLSGAYPGLPLTCLFVLIPVVIPGLSRGLDGCLSRSLSGQASAGMISKDSECFQVGRHSGSFWYLSGALKQPFFTRRPRKLVGKGAGKRVKKQ